MIWNVQRGCVCNAATITYAVSPPEQQIRVSVLQYSMPVPVQRTCTTNSDAISRPRLGRMTSTAQSQLSVSEPAIQIQQRSSLVACILAHVMFLVLSDRCSSEWHTRLAHNLIRHGMSGCAIWPDNDGDSVGGGEDLLMTRFRWFTHSKKMRSKGWRIPGRGADVEARAQRPEAEWKKHNLEEGTALVMRETV